MDMEKLNLDSRKFHDGYNRGAAKIKPSANIHCADPSGSELTEREVRELDDRALNGWKVGRTDADKLLMINEVLRRKGTLKTHAHIVRRWLSERGLLTTAEKLSTPLEEL